MMIMMMVVVVVTIIITTIIMFNLMLGYYEQDSQCTYKATLGRRGKAMSITYSE
jgi:hypothetical protein